MCCAALALIGPTHWMLKLLSVFELGIKILDIWKEFVSDPRSNFGLILICSSSKFTSRSMLEFLNDCLAFSDNIKY